MKNYWLSLLFILFLSQSPIFGYNSESLVALALTHNPHLKSAQHQSKAAGSLYKSQSIFSKNPVFTFNYSNIPVTEFPSLTDHAMSGISLGISQYIASPFESSARKRLFRQRYLARQEILNEARNDLTFTIRRAHANLMFLYVRKDIFSQNKKTLQSIRKVAESLVAVNRMNITQLLKIRAEIYDLEISLKEADGQIHKGIQNLEKLVGIPLDLKKLQRHVKSWIQDNTIELKNQSFTPESHPIYKKYKILYAATEAALSMEKAKTVPGVTIGFDYRIRQKIAGKDSGEDFISLKASVPLPLYYPLKERHGINSKKERLRAAEKDLQNIRNELSSSWKGELKNFELLARSFSDYRNQILPLYYSVYQNQLSILPAGQTSLIDVLDSYRLYLKASLKEARLHRDLSISRAKLMHLLYQFPISEKKEHQKTNPKERPEHEK